MKLILLLSVVAVAVVVTASQRPKSDCEKHRESAIRTGHIMKLIPECEENGDYKAMQCYKDSKMCVCYDKKGHPASPISSKLKECGCYLKQKEKRDRGHDNPYVPQCESDGKWTPKQCWDFNNSCWCVDKTGERVGDIKSDGASMTCE